VRMTVRKATLNGPKPFGYFWASKVTRSLVYLSSAVGYPGSNKNQKRAEK